MKFKLSFKSYESYNNHKIYTNWPFTVIITHVWIKVVKLELLTKIIRSHFVKLWIYLFNCCHLPMGVWLIPIRTFTAISSKAKLGNILSSSMCFLYTHYQKQAFWNNFYWLMMPYDFFYSPLCYLKLTLRLPWLSRIFTWITFEVKLKT